MGFGWADGLFIVGMVFIMYFLIFLPKKKEQQSMSKMLANLKKGDKVLTSSGMHGEVSAIKDSVVTLRFHDNVRIDFDKSAISRALVEKSAVEKPAEAKA